LDVDGFTLNHNFLIWVFVVFLTKMIERQTLLSLHAVHARVISKVFGLDITDNNIFHTLYISEM